MKFTPILRFRPGSRKIWSCQEIVLSMNAWPTLRPLVAVTLNDFGRFKASLVDLRKIGRRNIAT